MENIPEGLVVSDMFTKDTYVVAKNGKFGIADRKGNLIVAYLYDEISKVNKDGFAHVKDGTKYGAIDKYGKLVFPCIIEKVLFKVDNFSVVLANNKNMIIDTKTYNKRCEYDEIQLMKSPYMQNLALVRNGNYYGILDVINNVEIIKVEYTKIEKIFETCYLVERGNEKGIKNASGGTILDCEYLEIEEDVTEFSLTVQHNNGKWGVVNKNSGRELIPCLYDEIEFLTDENNPQLRKITKDGKVGIYNTAQGKEFIPCVYDTLEHDKKQGLIHVCKNGKYGLLKENGEVLVECIADKKFEPVNKQFICSGKIFLSLVTHQIFTLAQYQLINQIQTGKIKHQELPDEILSSARCLKELVELARHDLKNNKELENEDALKFSDFVQNILEQKKNYEIEECKSKETGISEPEVQEFSKYAEENITAVSVVLLNTNSLVYQYTGDKDERGNK